MEQFELNKSYLFNDIEKVVIANSEELTLEELGEELIGEGFIVVKEHQSNKVCSFFLESSSGSGYQYKCIYNDWR